MLFTNDYGETIKVRLPLDIEVAELRENID